MIDATDRRLIAATQGGLPFVARPYHALAEELGLAPSEVMGRLRRMLASGVIRRIGAVPNHYRLGWTENGMSVWDVDDARLPELGPRVGALPFVTHCYRRPRRPPLWPYNLFAMVHGRAPEEMAEKIDRIGDLLGDACRGHDVLVSTRILKKSGLRLAG
jgi:DNA-binding Lrp family transcriptional regulator